MDVLICDNTFIFMLFSVVLWSHKVDKEMNFKLIFK